MCVTFHFEWKKVCGYNLWNKFKSIVNNLKNKLFGRGVGWMIHIWLFYNKHLFLIKYFIYNKHLFLIIYFIYVECFLPYINWVNWFRMKLGPSSELFIQHAIKHSSLRLKIPSKYIVEFYLCKERLLKNNCLMWEIVCVILHFSLGIIFEKTHIYSEKSWE